MDRLYRESLLWQQRIGHSFKRSLYERVHWDSRLIGITGARGTGKTTLLLQRLKELELPSERALYVPLDNLWFTENRLMDLIEEHRNRGGTHLFLDEVHKYPNWAQEIKHAHDLYPELRIRFSGSSIIDLREADADLSRRAILHELPGLSFREYLLITGILEENPIDRDTLIRDHERIALSITERIRPLEYFSEYLQKGYYPIFSEDPETYSIRLRQIIDLVIGSDLRFVQGFDPGNASKMARLLYVLAVNVPFKPKVTKLAEHIGIYRNTLVQYLHYLQKARLIETLYQKGRSIGTLRKPDKILLQNPNLAQALSPEEANIGSLRESFLASQLSVNHEISLPQKGDFLVDDRFLIEVGGKQKEEKQIKASKDAYLAIANIELGVGKRIPLWLFGFLY
ncbi:MAG: ATP-binding protein [Flavobacteriales bacterium]